MGMIGSSGDLTIEEKVAQLLERVIVLEKEVAQLVKEGER